MSDNTVHGDETSEEEAPRGTKRSEGMGSSCPMEICSEQSKSSPTFDIDQSSKENDLRCAEAPAMRVDVHKGRSECDVKTPTTLPTQQKPLLLISTCIYESLVKKRMHQLPGFRRRDPSEISCFVKYMVFSFNVVFWLIGLTILLVGLWAQIEKNPFSQLGTRLSKFYLDPAWLLIIVGGVTFVIGFTGCIGALRENTCLLACYAVLVGNLLLIELAIGILGFVFKDWVKEQLETQLDDMIIYYRDDPDLQSVIDWIQMDWLRCCGIHGPNDWDLNIYFNSSSEALGSPEAGGVPFSCCKTASLNGLVNYYCGHGARKMSPFSESIFQSGCLIQVQEWFSRNLAVVGSVAVGVATLESLMVCKKIYCEGCLNRGLDWIERNFAVMGGIASTVVAVEILGICFAQNLRSDVFAQRARWRYSH
ncbi:Tetraspanin-5 [Trichinella nelsoni]|uniref:Tetraspanin-5 n=1 Tax=Trichinella nelsoni TaxID=6336 RepID=A0A0V0RSX4_9BILA|nr:Tetraspanin-5 [Trichinella nelsoni]